MTAVTAQVLVAPTALVRRCASILLVVAIAATPVGAQRVPTITLKPADAKLDEEFTRVTGVRELADGRVLVADGKEVRLVVADFRAGSVEQVGRSGSGPGEYNWLARLFAVARDSTLLGDARNKRWLLLEGSRLVATVPADAPGVRTATATLLGADRAGHVLSTSIVRRADPNDVSGFADSMLVLRTERATGRADTVARLRPVSSRMTIGRGSDGKINRVEVRKPPFAADEQVLLLDDGWIAIARLEPYRVDWHAPDGRVVRGAPLPFSKTRVDDAEKRAFLEGLAAAGARVDRSPDSRDDWPDAFPPYTADALLAAPDGRLLIQRTQTHAAPTTRYDIVDRRGALAGALEIAKNEQLAGFGQKSVYVIVTDDDGIQRLQRHPWP